MQMLTLIHIHSPGCSTKSCSSQWMPQSIA